MDIDYLLFLQDVRNNFGGEDFFKLVSGLSYVAVAIPAIIFWCFNKKAGIFLLFNAAVGRIINDLLKGIFCIYRPWIKEAALVPSASAMAKASSFSFPSGHTQFATAIYGGFAFLFRKKLPLTMMVMCSILVLAIAFSRNFLGIHTPQDVIIAIIYSVCLFCGAEKIFNWLGADEKRQRKFFICGLGATILSALFLYFKTYPTDFINGKIIVDPQIARVDAFDALGFGLAFFLGWFMENKLIKFKTNVSAKERTRRLIIGFSVLGIISVIINPLLKVVMNFALYKFLESFLPIFSILFAIPLIFTRSER